MLTRRGLMMSVLALLLAVAGAAAAQVNVPLVVTIDVQPDAPNVIALLDGAIVEVAVMGSDELDVTDIDTGTLQLEGAMAQATTLSDVNGDSRVDLVARFPATSTTLTASSTTATLTGSLTTTGEAITGSAPVTVVVRAVRLDAALHTVNQPRDPTVCPGGASTCRGALQRAQVRLFQSPPLTTLESSWALGTVTSGCTTGSDGSCYLGAPAGGSYQVILRWRDPSTGETVYSLREVAAGAFTKPVVAVQDLVIEVHKGDGTVHVAAGNSQVVAGP